MDQYGRTERNFSLGQKIRKSFETNNPRTHHDILFAENSKEEIKQAYISKYNSKCKEKVILLITTDGEKWHYFAVKKLSA